MELPRHQCWVGISSISLARPTCRRSCSRKYPLLSKVGHGKITAEVLSKSNAPYLHALFQEAHRLTPTTLIAINKMVDIDNLEVHGLKIEKGDIFLLESYLQGMISDLVETPEEFRPEQWLQDTVEARKSSPRKIIKTKNIRIWCGWITRSKLFKSYQLWS